MIQRILLITGLAVAGLAAFLLGQPGRWLVTLPVVGRVAIAGRLVLMLASVLAVLSGALDTAQGTRWHRLKVGLLPALLTLASFVIGGGSAAVATQKWVLMGLAAVLPVVLAVNAAPLRQGWQRYAHVTARQVSIYGTAGILLTAIYGIHLRALLTAPLIGLTGTLLALLLWRVEFDGAPSTQHTLWEPRQDRQHVIRALVVGLVLAEIMWTILFWPVPIIVGGLVLLVAFYVTSGLLAAEEAGQVRRGQVLEYTLLGIALVTALILVVLRQG